MVRYLKVSRARKFLGGLSLVLALSSIGGCSFGGKNDDLNNQNSSYEYEMTDENDNLNGIETPEDIEIPNDTFTQDDIEKPNEVEVQGNNGKVDVVPEDSDNLTQDSDNSTQDNSNLTQGNDNLDMEIPNIGNYEGRSISDALRLAGYPYNYKYRKALAARLGIENYRGTAKQNLLMLELLIDYAKSLEEQVPSNEDSQTNNQDNNNNNNNNNGDHNHGDDNEKDHVFGNTLTRYEKYDDDSHYVITYLKCVDCSYSIELGRKLESHNITSTYTVHEKEDENGYDEVTYGRCADCNAVVEISRRYVKKTPVEECDHTHTHTETRIENETETEHEEVVYEVCDDCGNKKEVSRNKVVHTYEDKVVSNDNGTHSHVRTYKCSNGKTYTKTMSTENCNYGSVQTRQEDVTDDGYYLVTYKVCSECGYEYIISRKYVETNECDHTKTHEVTRIENESNTTHTYEEVVYEVCDDCGREKEIRRVTKHHTYVDGKVISNSDGTHKYSRTYTRSDGKTYVVTITDNCSYTNEPMVIENESEVTHTYEEVIYGECDECGHRKVMSRVTKNHTYSDEVVSNDNGTHSIIRTYTRSDGRTYTNTLSAENCVSNGVWYTGIVNGALVDYQICEVCGQKINIKAHTHDLTGDWVPCTDRDGFHQKTCPGCNEPVYEECHMEDVYENGDRVGRRCPDCGRYEEIQVNKHEHNYDTNVIVIEIDGTLYDVHVCLNYDENCDAQYDIIGVHQHNFEYGDYIDNGDGTCSQTNGKCSGCGELGPIDTQSHSYIYCEIIDNYGEGAGCYFHTKCEHCGAKGPEGYSADLVNIGDHYDPSVTSSLSQAASYSAEANLDSDSDEEEYSETTDEEVVIVVQEDEEVVIVVQDDEETVEEEEETIDGELVDGQIEEDVKRLRLTQ